MTQIGTIKNQEGKKKMTILDRINVIGKTILAIHDSHQFGGDIYIEFEGKQYLKLTTEYSGDETRDVAISDDGELEIRHEAALGLISWDEYHKREKQKQEQSERRQLAQLKSKYEK